MKKQLLASTALVAAALLTAADMAYAQQKAGPAVQLGVGGYMRQEFGVVLDRRDANFLGRNDVTAPGATGNGPAGNGTDTATSFDQQTDAEIHFLGLGKLDNGIEVGARVELEVAGSPGNMIDEQYLFVRGSFGQIELGSTDSAAIKATLGYMGSWATQVGDNSAFGPGDWINSPSCGITAGAGGVGVAGGNCGGQDGTLRNMQLRMFDDDSNKVSYFTPRFAGFQMGVSYTPEFSQNNFAGTGGSPAPSASVAGATGAVIGNGTELGVPSKRNYHEAWSLGANLDRKFDQFGVGIAAGYVRAKSPGVQSANTATLWKNTDDAQTWGIGGSLEFGPFKVSAGYRENIDVRDGYNSQAGYSSGGGAATSLDGALYDVGARYTFGPNAVSVSYRSGYIEGTRADPAEPEEQAFMVSFRRTLAPGVNWDANVFYLKGETEPALAALTGNSPTEVSGWAITTAIQLNF